mmetsp:Transcript_9503/g.11944  ORF Transcript_9503/g.11944 Transcript_9503/m.11944 type:complete len:420 (+) Transcript_9503:45-1304(+)
MTRMKQIFGGLANISNSKDMKRTKKVAFAIIASFAFVSLNVLNTSPKLRRRALAGYGGYELEQSRGGDCVRQNPYIGNNSNGTSTTFSKTLITGYPAGDKRMTFVQRENEPFIKANYPHHEGIWAWGKNADQVVMIVRNIRHTLAEYHDFVWDAEYTKTWEDATLDHDTNSEHPLLENFLNWRDERVMDEIDWYGWFIDFYMENGLMRDVFTHKITTPEHWYMIMQPKRYHKDELAYDLIVGNQTVTPTQDPHCLNDIPTCVPIELISAENIGVNSNINGAEGHKMARALKGKHGKDDWFLGEGVWDCILEELSLHKKGLEAFSFLDWYNDIDPTIQDDYNFSEEILDKMIAELDRLIEKYDAPGWAPISVYLVELLGDYRRSLNKELDEVKSGLRVLNKDDFLGAETRREISLFVKEK